MNILLTLYVFISYLFKVLETKISQSNTSIFKLIGSR